MCPLNLATTQQDALQVTSTLNYNFLMHNGTTIFLYPQRASVTDLAAEVGGMSRVVLGGFSQVRSHVT